LANRLLLFFYSHFVLLTLFTSDILQLSPKRHASRIAGTYLF